MLGDLHYFEQLITAISTKYNVSIDGPDIYKISPKSVVKNKKVIAFVAITHGNEVVGLHIFNELLLRLIEGKFILRNTMYLILANRAAYIKQQRCIDRDLNRVYGLDGVPKLLEEKRAQEIKRVINTSDFIIDIHQTIEETLSPFFIVPYSKRAYGWLSMLAYTIPIIFRDSSKTISTLSSYGSAHDKIAVTFEVGSSGADIYQVELGVAVLERSIMLACDEVRKEHSLLRVKAPVYRIQHHEPYSGGKVTFVSSCKNFESIKKKQRIALVDEKEIVSPMDGKILLYPRKFFDQGSTSKTEGLFFIIKEEAPKRDF